MNNFWKKIPITIIIAFTIITGIYLFLQNNPFDDFGKPRNNDLRGYGFKGPTTPPPTAESEGPTSQPKLKNE